jgi:uncharacterized protein (DUF1778 family)
MSVRDKKIIETAAKLKDLKPNTYAPQKLLEVAEKDIAEMSQINTLILNNSEWEKFIEIMEAPIKINKNLKKAITKFNKVNK